jgi:hypothetical protein
MSLRHAIFVACDRYRLCVGRLSRGMIDKSLVGGGSQKVMLVQCTVYSPKAKVAHTIIWTRVLHRICYSNVAHNMYMYEARLICATYAWHLRGIRTTFRAQHSRNITITSSAVCHDSKTKKSTRQSFFNFQENLNEGKWIGLPSKSWCRNPGLIRCIGTFISTLANGLFSAVFKRYFH